MSPWRLTPFVRYFELPYPLNTLAQTVNRPPWRESVYVLARPERFRVIWQNYFFFFLAAFLVFFFFVVFFAAFFFVVFLAAFLRRFLAIRSPPFLNKIVHHDLTLSKKFFSQRRCATHSANSFDLWFVVMRRENFCALAYHATRKPTC